MLYKAKVTIKKTRRPRSYMQTADKVKIEKKYTIIIAVCCILPVVVLFIYGNFIIPTHREAFLKSELKGVVVDKYVNQKNHGLRTIQIKENQKETISELIANPDTLLYNYVIPGDIIFKTTNQDFFIVQRKDSIRKFIIPGDDWAAVY
jgi:hypothetical protein